MSRVDVVIPCFNYGRYLQACTQSVLEQPGVDVRVLIIDDCSTDGSADIARALARRDDRISLIVHDVNRGHIATYNEGLDWVTAEYMLLLSADDVVAPGAFPRAVAIMEANAEVVLVYGRAEKFQDDGELPKRSDDRAAASAILMPGLLFIERICSRPHNPVETATALVRSGTQKRVGGYRPALPHAGDLEMWLRFAAAGSIAILPTVQAYVRIHQNNMRHQYSADSNLRDAEQRLACFRLFFTHSFGDATTGKHLLHGAERSIAQELLWSAMRMLEQARIGDANRLAAAAVRACPWILTDLLSLKFLARRLLVPFRREAWADR